MDLRHFPFWSIRWVSSYYSSSYYSVIILPEWHDPNY